MNESATTANVKRLDDGRQILTETAKISDTDAIAQLRALLKDITQLMPIDEDEELEEEDAEDALAAKSILQNVAFELRDRNRTVRLGWST